MPFAPIPTRATIIAATDSAEEQRAAREWFERASPALTFISENEGCGCCVDMWRVEGPPEVLSAIPECIAAQGAWSHPWTGDRPAAGPSRPSRPPRRPIPKWKYGRPAAE